MSVQKVEASASASDSYVDIPTDIGKLSFRLLLESIVCLDYIEEKKKETYTKETFIQHLSDIALRDHDMKEFKKQIPEVYFTEKCDSFQRNLLEFLNIFCGLCSACHPLAPILAAQMFELSANEGSKTIFNSSEESKKYFRYLHTYALIFLSLKRTENGYPNKGIEVTLWPKQEDNSFHISYMKYSQNGSSLVDWGESFDLVLLTPGFLHKPPCAFDKEPTRNRKDEVRSEIERLIDVEKRFLFVVKGIKIFCSINDVIKVFYENGIFLLGREKWTKEGYEKYISEKCVESIEDQGSCYGLTEFCKEVKYW
jgi:hypothetical protein